MSARARREQAKLLVHVRAEMAEPTAVKTKRKVEMNSAQYERRDAAETLRLRWATRLVEDDDAMAEKLSCLHELLRSV